MKIGIDIDDTLMQCMPLLIEYHNDVYNTQFKLEQFKSWGLWKTWGGTLEDDIRKIYNFYKSEYFKKMLPVLHSQESVNKLNKRNELVIMTARPDTTEKDTRKSIEKYFPNCFEEIYFTSSYLSDGDKINSKKDLCELLNIEVVVEDSLNNSLDCVDSNRNVFLMDRPWNSFEDLPENIKRVDSWKEIVEIIYFL